MSTPWVQGAHGGGGTASAPEATGQGWSGHGWQLVQGGRHAWVAVKRGGRVLEGGPTGGRHRGARASANSRAETKWCTREPA